VKTSSFSKFLSFWKNRSKRATRSQSPSCKPTLESLGDRVLPAAGSISGYVYHDMTGNGLSADDTGMSNVVVELFVANNNHGFFGFGGEKLAGLQLSAANGSYSFNNLPAGQYSVYEFTPFGDIETDPSSGFGYSVSLASGQAVTGEDFTNFQLINTSGVRNISYNITTPSGSETTVKNLNGHTQQGDTVTVNFTIAPHTQPITLSLVSYNAPGPHTNASNADEDTLFADSTGTFGPGQYSLTVQLPNNYYEVNFVAGVALTQVGPAGSSISYQAQGRLLGADGGGTNAVQNFTLSGTVTDTNGNLLAGATITLTNETTNAQTVVTTASDGTYSITGLQAGSYNIYVSDPGYVAQSITVTLTSSEVENFSLTPQQIFA
jgi:hypothetical protein